MLQGDELRLQISLETQEEQPGIQPAQCIAAVGEVVTAPQYLLTAVGRGMGQCDVRVLGDQGSVVGADGAELRLIELAAPRQGSALLLGPAEHRLLLAKRRAVPGLDRHADLAHGQVRAAVHPGWLVVRTGPHEFVEAGLVVGGDVGRSVLESEQVARCRLALGGDGTLSEAHLGPLDSRLAEGEAHQVANRVHGDLGVVGASLDADVSAAERWIDGVAGEVRQVGQRGRLLVGDAEPVDPLRGPEQGGPESDRDRQSRGR